jgi:hypothetical protein
MSGNVNRQKKEEERKVQGRIKEIETIMPTGKTTDPRFYLLRILFIKTFWPQLSAFYNFQTAEIRFKNYRGRQQTIDEATNILLNGGKKYNREKRRMTKRNRRKRKKMMNRRNVGISHRPIEPRYVIMNFCVMYV